MIDTYPVELAHACSWEPVRERREGKRVGGLFLRRRSTWGRGAATLAASPLPNPHHPPSHPLQGESTDTRKPWRFLPKLGGGKADALAAARADAEAARGAAHGAAARAAASDAAAADAAGRLAMLQVKHELLIDMVSGREGGEERWGKGTARRLAHTHHPSPLSPLSVDAARP